MYEGCLINKLQNSVILLVFRIWKIPNICFVENFILNFRRNFFDGAFIEHILYVYYFLHL